MTGCRGNAGLAQKHAPLSRCECAVGSSFQPNPGRLPTAGDSEAATIQPALFFFDVHYFEGSPDIYQIPLAISAGAALDVIAANRPDSIVARLTQLAGPAILHDAVVREDFHQELLGLIAAERNASGFAGRTSGSQNSDAAASNHRAMQLEKLAEAPGQLLSPGAAQCSTRRSGRAAAHRRAADSICRRSPIAASRVSFRGRFSARGRTAGRARLNEVLARACDATSAFERWVSRTIEYLDPLRKTAFSQALPAIAAGRKSRCGDGPLSHRGRALFQDSAISWRNLHQLRQRGKNDGSHAAGTRRE